MTHKTYKKVALVILDGFGIASPGKGNPISLVSTPNFDYLVANFPGQTLQASGPLVGLPWGEMGNSEVGHLNLGAGRIVGHDLPRITAEIQSGAFFKNPVFLEAIKHVKDNNSKLHLMGMVSPGGVHSLEEHLYALLGLAAQNKIAQTYIHMFTDGRDTGQRQALESLEKLEDRIAQLGIGQIATIAGRFYAMDRGGHWKQTLLTYQAMVEGLGETAGSAEEYITRNYQSQIFDEMLKPAVIMGESGQPVAKISENDAIIFFNFRSDRALQLTEMFANPELVPQEFRQPIIPNLYFATMTEYFVGLNVHIAYPLIDLKNNLAEVVAEHKMTQFHIAESEKYAHVTSFFNGGKSEALPGEERLIVESPDNNAKNYADQPEMSEPQLTDKLVEKITKTETNFFVANFANGDMVGHTGNLEASKKAVQCLDVCMGKILSAILLVDGGLIVTADHGNLEEKINIRTGEIGKDHTTNPVPFLLAANEFKFKKPKDIKLINLSSQVPFGAISDVAPTILDLFGLPKPAEMTGINLLDGIG